MAQQYRKLPHGKEPLDLGVVTGGVLARRVRSGVFCAYTLDVYTCATSGADTDFTYQVRCDYALTRAQQMEIRAFIAGMKEMWRLSA